MAGRVTGPVDHEQRLPGVGQSDQQRRITPDAFIGDVDALLELTSRGHDRAVHIQIGHLPEQTGAAAGPQLGPYRVDRVHQRHDVVLGETAQEVTRGGRVRQQPCPQPVHQRHVVAQPVHILQPGAAAQHAVAG